MSCPIDVVLTTRFFDTPWSPQNPTKHHTFFGYDQADWKFSTHWSGKQVLPFPYGSPQTGVGVYTHWTNTKQTETHREPPKEIMVASSWDDDVSVLNDDPDEDDDQLLPRSTYDVLAPLLDEMYNDGSEGACDDEGHSFRRHEAATTGRKLEGQDVHGNGARAA